MKKINLTIMMLGLLTIAPLSAKADSYHCEIKCKSVNNEILFNQVFDDKTPWADYKTYCNDLKGDMLQLTDTVVGCPRGYIVCAKSGVEAFNQASAYGENLVQVKTEARNACVAQLTVKHDCSTIFFDGKVVITSATCEKY